MAVKREIRTTLALDGESEYKKALSEAQRGLRVLGSELKLASAEFETNGDKQAFLTAKSQTLRSEIAQQEEIVKSLEGAVKDAGEKYGETAKATDDYQIKLNSAKATLEKMRRELDATDREAQDLGRDSVRVGRQLEDGIGDGADQAKESLESMAAQMKQSLEEIKSSSFVTAAGSAWNMAQGVYQGLSELEESSREYNRTLAIFKQNVEDDGFDYEWAKGKADEVASITGSIESALSGVRAKMCSSCMRRSGASAVTARSTMGSSAAVHSASFTARCAATSNSTFISSIAACRFICLCSPPRQQKPKTSCASIGGANGIGVIKNAALRLSTG